MTDNNINASADAIAEMAAKLADGMMGNRPAPPSVPTTVARRTTIVHEASSATRSAVPSLLRADHEGVPDRFKSPVWMAGADETIPHAIGAAMFQFRPDGKFVPVVPTIQSWTLDRMGGWVICGGDGTVIERFAKHGEAMKFRRTQLQDKRYVIWSVWVLAEAFGVTL